MILELQDSKYSKAGTFVISSHEIWLPGSYADRRTAMYAFRFSNDILWNLQEKLNKEILDPKERNITFEMLQKARKLLC